MTAPDSMSALPEHPNVTRTREAIEAFRQGDPGPTRRLWAPDVAWHAVGRHPLARTYRGIDDVLGYVHALFTLSEGSFDSSITEIYGDDHLVVAVFRNRARRGSAQIDVRSGLVMDFDGGQIVALTELQFDPDAWDLFWTAAAGAGNGLDGPGVEVRETTR